MNGLEFTAEESIDHKLIKDINQIQFSEVAECQVCGKKPREGDDVVAFAFRPADRSTFQLAHVKCTDCRHEPTELFTLGVRELVVEGRVGRCADQATQSSWPVLLAPQPRAVSPVDTTRVHPFTGTVWLRYPIAAGNEFVAADQDTTRKPWQRPVQRAETVADESRTSAADADADNTDDNSDDSDNVDNAVDNTVDNAGDDSDNAVDDAAAHADADPTTADSTDAERHAPASGHGGAR